MRAIDVSAVSVALLLVGCGGGGGSDSSSSASANSGPPTTTISGVVLDGSGAPIPGVTMTVFLTNEHHESTTTTDANGRYTFAGLRTGFPYGNYEIWAKKTGLGFLPYSASPATSILRTDHWAQFKTVLAVPSPTSVTVNDADFRALHSNERVVTLPRTGQTTSYVSGDDASVGAGVAVPASRFVDNHDGTITDTLTGLVWLQDAGCFQTQLWGDALAAANQLASGSCGLSDGSIAGQWHMPNVTELESLVDASSNNPALTVGHPFLNVASTYWSSTTYRGVPTAAWVIRFSDGRYINDSIVNLKVGGLNSLWAVKSAGANKTVDLAATGQFTVYGSKDDGTLLSGKRLPYPRFIDNSDGTVTDLQTGLIWLKRADCIHQPWANAIAATNALASGQCGLTDSSTAGQWRMPNRLELLSLVDRAETNQALRFNSTFYNYDTDSSVDQLPVFSNFIELEYYWTSTTSAADMTQAWTVFSCDFGVYSTAKDSVGYTLAVR